MAYSWPLFVALAANFFFFFSFQSLFSVFPLFVTSLGGRAAAIGALQSAFALAAILFRPVAGWVCDRVGRKTGLILGSFIFTLSMLLYCLIKDLKGLFFLRAFHGTGIAFFTTAFAAFLSDIAPPERRGEIMGLGGIPAPVSLLFAPLLGDFLARGGNFSRLFLTGAGFGALAVILSLTLPETLKRSGQGRSSLPLAKISVPVILTVAIGVSYGSVITFLPVFLAERAIGPAGFFYSVFSLMLLPTLLLGGRLSDKLGRSKVVIPAAGLVILAMGFIPLIRTRLLLALLALIYGLGYGALRPTIDALIVDRVLPLARGKALGFNYAGFDLGIGLGALFLGYLAQGYGYSSVYTASAIVVAAAGAIFLREVSKC